MKKKLIAFQRYYVKNLWIDIDCGIEKKCFKNANQTQRYKHKLIQKLTQKVLFYFILAFFINTVYVSYSDKIWSRSLNSELKTQ